MNNSMHTFLLVAALCTVLSACQTIGGGSPNGGNGGSSEEAALDAAQRLGEAKAGELISIPLGDTGDSRSVTVGEIYTAASGRRCRHLFTMDRQPLQQVVCATARGQWELQRALSTSHIGVVDLVPANYRQTPDTSGTEKLDTSDAEKLDTPAIEKLNTPRTEKLDTVEAEKGELASIPLTIQATETLWSFSERVTGDGLNWEVIANVNDIDDPRSLASATVLNVPASLVIDELGAVSEQSVERRKLQGQ